MCLTVWPVLEGLGQQMSAQSFPPVLDPIKVPLETPGWAHRPRPGSGLTAPDHASLPLIQPTCHISSSNLWVSSSAQNTLMEEKVHLNVHGVGLHRVRGSL